MNVIRRIVNDFLFGAEERVETFLKDIEGVCCELTRRAIGFAFGVVEVVVEQTFDLVRAVTDAVLGKESDDDIIDEFLSEGEEVDVFRYPVAEDFGNSLQPDEKLYCVGTDGECPTVVGQEEEN